MVDHGHETVDKRKGDARMISCHTTMARNGMGGTTKDNVIYPIRRKNGILQV